MKDENKRWKSTFRAAHCSDCDQSVHGLAVFYLASFCLDADQVSEVLEVEEQQVVAKVQERQTLQGRRTETK